GPGRDRRALALEQAEEGRGPAVRRMLPPCGLFELEPGREALGPAAAPVGEVGRLGEPRPADERGGERDREPGPPEREERASRDADARPLEESDRRRRERDRDRERRRVPQRPDEAEARGDAGEELARQRRVVRPRASA